MFDRFTKIIFLGTRQATLAARHVEQRSLPTNSLLKSSCGANGTLTAA
ncbi:Uncharacterized protein HZ326_17466, partial [Fusarium oxysporum f. sp. albedinis]